MATFIDPAADAATAHQGLRALAHATRRTTDPAAIYAVLGSLTLAASAFEQTLHQLAAFHDGPDGSRCRVEGDPRKGRAAAYQVSWELHRAGEIMRQVAAALGRAHEVEGTISYPLPDVAVVPERRSPRIEHGPRL